VIEVSRDEFEQMVGAALDEIPAALAAEFDNVAVMVEDWPTAEQLARVAPGGMLLGLYEGVPLTSRGPLSYSGVAPDGSRSSRVRCRDAREIARSSRRTFG
jgi:predicted Zn-dependent protease with MMP-like domain